MAPLRLGTRGSALAVAQSTLIARQIEALGQQVELIRIRTSGDEATASPEQSSGRNAAADRRGSTGAAVVDDKARFVKELEQALLGGEIDLAVHSAKDVPGELPGGLEIVGVPERADARDALCVWAGGDTAGDDRAAASAVAPGAATASLDQLPSGVVVGTASLRRKAQLRAARPDLDLRDLRGNVDTRLRKLAEREVDAIVLAIAGLIRLDRAADGQPLPADALLPAAGQGCLALEARADDAAVRELARRLTDPDSLAALGAERALVTGIDATCHTPVGAHATVDGDGLLLRTFVGTPDGSTWIRDEVTGDRADPESVGAEAAERLLAAGARDILAAAEAGRR